MSGFIFFLVIVFVLMPSLSKMGKSKRTAQKSKFKSTQKTWGQTHAQIAKTETDQYGHSNTRKTRHQQMHSKDANQVFPEEHKIHVRAREARDKLAQRNIEKAMHSRNNTAIIQVGNKGRSDWGVRGDTSGLIKPLLIIVILGVVVYYGFEYIGGN
ncbi:MAG TPA: hypothetical protein ENJ46_00825 [Hellea balneolensis]|uniref:Uncharacterized protein n=1 Tax=Hellea balneolensis TaxID=287478 RepID=A0A7C3C109_9PROT|nr:hypothetical protein [Hellea balneolensis]